MEKKLHDIINLILRNRGREPIEKISRTNHLRNDIGFDSMDLAELTVRIEAETGIDIFETEIVNTVQEVLNILEKE